MAVLSAVVYSNVHRLTESSGWVTHTYQVIRIAEVVQAALVDMETGQRGFTIAGEDEYLEPYNNGITKFDRLIVQGQSLTSDNPTQVAHWRSVEALKKQWVENVAEQEIAARREVTKGAEAFANFKSILARTIGKDIFDSIRVVLATIDNKFAGNLAGRHLVTSATLDLVNMETGQRGFLLTGEEQSLAPLHRRAKSV